MSKSITFDADTFSSLTMEEFTGQWNPVGIEDLSDTEQSIFFSLLSYLPSPRTNDGEVEQDNILLAKAGKGGILNRIYGPCLFSDGEEIVLKFGANEFVVNQEKTEFKCGVLVGDLEFVGDIRDVTIKANHEEKKASVQNCVCKFLPEGSDEDIEFVVGVRTDANKNPVGATIKKHLRKKNDNNLAEFLAPIPQGGGGNGNTIKMRDMKVGEYSLEKISELPEGKYGVPFILHTASGMDIWAQGNAQKSLRGGFRMNGEPVTLQISDIRKSADGSKTYVDCALRKRYPRVQEPSIEIEGIVLNAAASDSTAPLADSVIEDVPF